LNLLQAVNDALKLEMRRDPRVVVLGEDVGKFGGVFRATAGLYEEFGANRVIDTPLAENGIIGTALGMALYGLRPVPEIQFADFIFPAFDQIVNEVAKFRYRSVVSPSNPYDAKGLLLAAMRNEDPVLFFEPKRIYRAAKGEVPEDDYEVELGKAKVIREGDDVTVIAYGAMLHEASEAVDEAAKLGIECELIDLRTLWPLDIECLVNSSQKTGRIVVVHEAPRTCGLGAEISTLLQERCFVYLQAPIKRVTGWDTPFPYSLENEYLPRAPRILQGIRETAEFVA
jgi:pyruvate dehydrogenase E1 component beta subunit